MAKYRMTYETRYEKLESDVYEVKADSEEEARRILGEGDYTHIDHWEDEYEVEAGWDEDSLEEVEEDD